MIIRNAYLGLLLLTLASASTMFAARGEAKIPVRGQRRTGVARFCCLFGAARGLQNVADDLESGAPVTLEQLLGSSLAGFTDAMFLDGLVRRADGARAGAATGGMPGTAPG